ncbi:MAG: hypothetical protein ACR2P4_06125 [Gammaproteobacteria bacterium]
MNRTPFQGFNTVIPAPLVIPAYAGISFCLLGDSGVRRNDGKKEMTGNFDDAAISGCGVRI